MSDKAVCRTAPATPGLLNIYLIFQVHELKQDSEAAKARSTGSRYTYFLYLNINKQGKPHWQQTLAVLHSKLFSILNVHMALLNPVLILKGDFLTAVLVC